MRQGHGEPFVQFGLGGTLGANAASSLFSYIIIIRLLLLFVKQAGNIRNRRFILAIFVWRLILFATRALASSMSSLYHLVWSIIGRCGRSATTIVCFPCFSTLPVRLYAPICAYRLRYRLRFYCFFENIRTPLFVQSPKHVCQVIIMGRR